MNPKTFTDLYNGLQAIENEKKQTIRGVRKKNYQTGGMQQGSTNMIINTYAVQQMRRFSNFNQPSSKVLEHLVQRGLLQPLVNVKPLSPKSPGYDPSSYCSFH